MGIIDAMAEDVSADALTWAIRWWEVFAEASLGRIFICGGISGAGCR